MRDGQPIVEPTRYEQKQPRPCRKRSVESYPRSATIVPFQGLDDDRYYRVTIEYEEHDGEVSRCVRHYSDPQQARGFAKRALASYHPSSYRGAAG